MPFRVFMLGVVAQAVLTAWAGVPVAIKNSDFEAIGAKGEAPGWILPKSGAWRAVSGAGYNGSGGLVFEGKGPKWHDWPHQYVTVKAGKRYRLSANLKADGLTSEKKSRWNGLSVYVEWFDAAGKITGANMSHCVQGTTDWVHRESITPVVKPGVAKCRVMAVINCASEGRAIIDDVSLVEYDEAPVSGVWSSAYRDTCAEGPVTFAAGLNPPEGKSCTALFTYTASDGTRRTVAGERPRNDEARLTLDAAELGFGTNEVICSLQAEGKELGRASRAFARVGALPPRKVTFDRHQRLIVDGKPFLPIGIYCLEIDKTNMAQIADSAFNCVMSYRFPVTRKDLDTCQAAGIKLICNVRCKVDELYDDAIGRNWLKKNIPLLKDHPALLAWYSDDESALTLVPRLRGRYELIHALDGDHPVWAVQDKWASMRDYLGTFDVFGTDPYPISAKPIDLVSEAMRLSRRGTFGLKPTWHVPQGFRWNRPGDQTPTRAEILNMTWQAFAGGANGFVTFRYFQLRELAKVDPKNGLKYGEIWWREIWPSLKVAAREVKDREAILLAEPDAPVAGLPDTVVARAWKKDGKRWVLAVNTTRETVRIDLEGAATELPPLGYVFRETSR